MRKNNFMQKLESFFLNFFQKMVDVIYKKINIPNTILHNTFLVVSFILTVLLAGSYRRIGEVCLFLNGLCWYVHYNQQQKVKGKKYVEMEFGIGRIFFLIFAILFNFFIAMWYKKPFPFLLPFESMVIISMLYLSSTKNESISSRKIVH